MGATSSRVGSNNDMREEDESEFHRYEWLLYRFEYTMKGLDTILTFNVMKPG
jgi:hypothetical protein